MVRKCLIFASLWVMSAASAFGQEAEFKAYHDSAGEVVRLSSQETEPFLFQGKTLEPGHPRADNYANSLKRFPDVRSCLLKAERNKPQPDLTQFDWDTLDTTNDAEVCLFRVASSYNSPEAMKNWVESQGFKAEIRILDKKKRIIVDGAISLDKSWPKITTGLTNKLWLKLVAYSQTISIQYDVDKNTLGVYAMYNIL